MASVPNRTCEECGAAITPAQISQRQAGLVKGVLLCPDCVAERRRAALAQKPGGSGLVQGGSGALQGSGVLQGSGALQAGSGSLAGPRAAAAPAAAEEEPLTLVGEEEMTVKGASMIRSFATGSTLGSVHHDDRLKRPLAGPAEGATRCRTFHAKLTDPALAYMDDQINEWLDANPDIYVKTSSATIGPFEGKHVEHHLILTLFY